MRNSTPFLGWSSNSRGKEIPRCPYMFRPVLQSRIATTTSLVDPMARSRASDVPSPRSTRNTYRGAHSHSISPQTFGSLDLPFPAGALDQCAIAPLQLTTHQACDRENLLGSARQAR